MNARVKKPSPSPASRASAFTLVEVLVSVSVLAIMMTIMADLMVRTQDTISRASAHATEFQEARRVMDGIGNALSQSTMDAVWAYRRSAQDASSPTGYERISDHHFILGPASELLTGGAETGQAVFFQAPLGRSENADRRRLHDLVNCCGFYVQYGSDLAIRPSFLQNGQPAVVNPERSRFRLMQYVQPAEDSILYGDSSKLGLNKLTSRTQALRWYQQDLGVNSRPLADNILALVLTPHATQTDGGRTTVVPDPQFRYDSRDFQWNGLNATNKSRRHQLPVMVGITLVAADESSYEALVHKLGEKPAGEAVRAVLAGKFARYSQLKDDIAAVQQGLAALPLHHKVLSSSVTLRGSKWISEDEL